MSDNTTNPTIFETLLDLWDPKALLAALPDIGVNLDWIFAGGFKKDPASLKKASVRKKLARGLRKSPELKLAFLQHASAPWEPHREFLDILDQDWLRMHWREILRTGDLPSFAAALAADSREPISRRGRRLLERPLPAVDSLFPAPDEINRLISRFTTPPEISAPEKAVNEGLHRKLERQLEQANDSLKKLRADKNEMTREIQRLRDRQSDNQKSHREEVANLKKMIAQEKAAARDRLEAGLNAYRKSLFGSEETQKKLAAELCACQGEDLQVKARKALRLQAEADRAFGTRHALANEAELLGKLLQSVGQAFEQAVNPLPELVAIRRELQDRIAVIEKLLAKHHWDSAFSQTSLEEIIEHAPQGNSGRKILAAAEELLAGPLSRELYSPDQQERLRTSVARRRKWLVTMEHEAILSRQPAPENDSCTKQAPWELINLGMELRQSPAPPILLIDAYNLIMNPDFKLFGTRNGPEAARNYLESLLAKQTSQFHAIRVVYDSPSLLKTSEKRLGLRIIYARLRGEDQQADDEIVHFLETFGPEGAENPPVWLVSDDRGLRLRAASHCQGFVACEDLIRHLMLS